jgi:tetratricopeptide (TPR) repeat protein
MSDQAPSAAALDSNEATLAALERALRRAEGFALYFVRCNPSALRREALGRLREGLSGSDRGIVEIDLDEPITDLLSVLREPIPDPAAPPLAVSVSGLELSIPASTDGGILAALNIQRESLPSAVSCPLLLWLPEHAMQRLIVGAPDFYAWRSAEYQLVAAGPEGAPAIWDELPRSDWQVRNLPPADRERRRQALEGMVDELRSLPPSPGRDRDLAAALSDLGFLASQCRRFDEAEECYTKSLGITERLGGERDAAIIYHQLGRIAEERRRFDEAEEWHKKSLEITLRLGDEHGAAITYHQLGIIAQERRRFDEAEEWYRKSLEIKLRLGDEYDAAITYHQLGMVAQERRTFDEAEEWYRKSLEIALRLGNEHGAALTYGQLGLLAEQRGDMTSAVEHLRRALAVFERLDDPHDAEVTRRNLARVTAKP